MAGQKFQYDESGGTFFYFLLSFLALILIPATLYYWPRKKKEDPNKYKDECQCPSCIRKRLIIATSEPYRFLKELLVKSLIIAGWVLLGYLTYRVSQFDYEMSNFDPYEILGLETSASLSEIKRAYRKLSLLLHPDKETGDEKAFMKLSKAYQALTDDESRKNWEKYGNPDGPGAMSFGIALPSWIVEKENSVWVLGLYALVFMVALPVAVGTWWYRSIRFSGDKVLLDTTQLYLYFFHKTPQMAMKRVIMILAASLEFDKRHNSQVIERPSDNDEVPSLIRQLPNLNEKCKEIPLCRMYSVKTRAILHAHLSRIELNSDTLDKDRQLIVQKCPYLIQEMVSCVNQLIMLAYARRISKLPSIETIENCMKLSPMIIQGLWEFKSPFLQLPFVSDDHLRMFSTKKRHIKNLQQFAQLKPEESRHILKHLSDFEYEQVIRVLSKMPLIDFSIRCEVIDDENTNVVTAGAIVTVTVTLVRNNMSELFGNTDIAEKQSINDDEEQPDGDGNEEQAPPPPPVKRSAWVKPSSRKPHKGGAGAKNKHKGGKLKQTIIVKQDNTKVTPAAATKDESESDGMAGDSDAGSDRSSDNEEKKVSSVEDDDEEWEKFQKKLNKREKLEGKSKISHSVHCPYFPEDKQEYWWTYICDRKSRTLLTAPYHVTNLVEREEVQLKFTAPRWPGVYTFSVCLRSDSYVGMDQQLELKLDVKEASAVPTEHPQWDISESESEKEDPHGNESEFTTDSSDEDD
ncbi:translocation protein SEC63 homolog isoform X1 [Contarinia nasturtii]|uniref:translocation protein SEC63 homolog isoform X1 n=2 Tax=Contarinia nasturtii TaxID=265458 RepID=UPI0012D3B1D6|nr:translocation protein SEC63 homolog isoform X1 [Contarinia nasturtii]XP_031640768.1 translocation protein SEC63 homolog isoform X1 [Contarinia nasturtii]